MKKKLNTRLLLLGLALTAAFACGGAAVQKAAMQQATPKSPKATPAPAMRENCSSWPEIVNAVFLQVLERPANGELAKTASDKLAAGETSVRELVATLVTSDEYKERFVSSQPTEEATRLLYRHVLARAASVPELKSVTGGATRDDAAKNFVAAARSLVAGEEYSQRFGARLVPGASSSVRPCRFPLKLSRQDSFSAGTMTTELTVAVDGKFQATTKIKSGGGKQPFCGKVGLWLLGEADSIVAVTGPVPEAIWCAGGAGPKAQQEHAEEWQGTIARELLDRTASAALLQSPVGVEPQVLTRANTERAAQIKQTVR